MMTGHRCKHDYIGFGEKVWFRHTKVNKDDYKKAIGIFIGANDRNQTYLVGTEDGVFASADAVKVPDEEV